MHMTRRGFARGVVASLMLLAGCAFPHDGTQGQDERQSSFFCFDTACSVGGVMPQKLLDASVARCRGFEDTLSRTRPSSDIGRINAAGGMPVEVDPETADLIQRALDYSQDSDGLFDITIGAVSSLWDFKEGVVPTPEQISDALPHVGYQNVRLEGKTVRLLDPLAQLDLGGIAKGYVADVLCDELAAQGVTSAYVNLGGNVKVLGTKADGSLWRVGVREPSSQAVEAASIARTELDGGSVVTSGLYERRFEVGGHAYWHILDPRTGYPVDSDLVSATIVSEHSIDGEGYTKPLFMIGVENALAFLEERDLEGLLVDSHGNIHQTSGAVFELL